MNRAHQGVAALAASKAQQARIKRENAAHTPGEWAAVGAWVEHPDDDTPDICSCNPADLGQAQTRSYAEMRANARLIAAAPDMLQVLQDLQESAAYWSEYDVPLGIVDSVHAAIAKATGQKRPAA